MRTQFKKPTSQTRTSDNNLKRHGSITDIKVGNDDKVKQISFYKREDNN